MVRGGVGSTSLNESVNWCSENTNENKEIAENETSMEVDENTSFEKSSNLALDSKDDTTENNASCDADILSSKLMKELNEENKTIGNLEVHNLVSEAYVGSVSNLPFGVVLAGDTPSRHEELSMAIESMNVEVSGNLPNKKLLVLDVNGLLVDINSFVPYDYDPDEIILKKAVFKRPYCDDFLDFCFERFNVGVWTSRIKSNSEPILDFLLGSKKSKLLFYWDQSHCTNTGFTTVEKRHKPLLLKKLKRLWEKWDPALPWERGVYNESNTLLLDDTPYKALYNPRYSAVFPFTYNFKDVEVDKSLGPEGDLRLYLEGIAKAENVQEYVKQNPFGQRAITERNLSWGYYRRVIEASRTPPPEMNE